MQINSLTKSKLVTHKAIVTGKVQGVYYRATTKEQALAMGLTGYAKNLSDGSVEVMVHGHQEKVEQLVTWLWQGPPMSKVTSVVSQTEKDYHLTGFLVL